jgi:outer membrane protein assembly factor BamB
MLKHRLPVRVVPWGFLPVAAAFALLAGGAPPAGGFIDFPAESLGKMCAAAETIAVLKVEKVNREKKGIVYSKARDLKGTFPSPNKQFGDTFTHVLGEPPTLGTHRDDQANLDLQNEAILAWAAEGKTAVIFQRGGEQVVSFGHVWYVTRGKPPANERWVLTAGSDSRYARFYCGEADGLVSAVTDLLAGKEVTVPRMLGTAKQLSDRTGPVRRKRADRQEKEDNEFYSPFQGQAAWATHRGNPQRTGSDDRPGPKAPKVLWVYKTEDPVVAPLVPGSHDLCVPGLGALAFDPAGDRQLRWSRGGALLRHPIAGEPALVGGHVEMLAFGDGFSSNGGSSLRCVRAADGFPLWRLSVEGKDVRFDGAPTFAGGRLYAGCGSAGVLCLEPARVTLDGKEQDLPAVQAELERRWQELRAKYEAERKKDPQFALPPDESMLPRPEPRRLWQQGQDRWHVDAPVAVVEDRVLAASASLEEDKAGECALVCLKAGDGEALWTAPLKLNPWAGPTVGPYVLVGCSSIRADPKGIPDAKGEVVAVELDTGKVRWRKDVPGGVLAAVAVKAGLAVFTATDGKVRAWDAFTGEDRWAYDAGAPFLAGVAVTDRAVYAADLKGVVHALSLADGKKEWSLDLAADPTVKVSGGTYGSPVVKGGRLFLATADLGERRGKAANAVVCIGDK